MGCTIPNFNLDVKVKYDITTVTPTVVITNQSTGANLANITYWFELYTPSGTMYHQGNSLTPDITGVWTTFNVAENIPKIGGKIEFDIVSPYVVKVFAKDNLNNTCDIVYEDIICAPNGNSGGNNFGETLLNVLQKCNEGVLQVIDVSNYLYKGVVGTLVSNQTILVYPTPSEGSAPPNTVVNNKNSFFMPIPVNGKGHQLIKNSVFNYILPSGNEIKIKYKFKNSSFEVNCGVSMCSIMCGLTKYRESLTNSDGTCAPKAESKIANLSLKIAQLTLALNSPLCGFDTASLYAEIKEELSLNGCLCDECEDIGNNNVQDLKCSDIDIACVWDSIVTLMTTTPAEKAKLCTLVTDCVNAMNGGCAQVFMSGVVFTQTKITVNYILSDQTISTNLDIFYKLHSSNTWILASTQPSNSTSFDINGTFTQNALYDVKVVNNCSGGVNTDSAIVSGIIPAQLTACNYLNDIYTGLGDGVYSIKVDNSQTGCAKYSYQLINGTFIESLMPCATPVNVKISSNSVLSWDGKSGDYEVSYKLKSSGTWIVHSTNTYSGTSNSINLATVITSAVELYDFRVRYRCTPSVFSLPIYTDFFAVVPALCQSPADFILFNESTGALLWFGGVSGANYNISAISGGSFLGQPLSYTINNATSVITIDYSNILSLINQGDNVVFYINTDCGNGNVSETASSNYVVLGAQIPCPPFNPPFSHSTIINNVVRINVGGVSNNDPEILFTQVELRVNSVHAGTSILVLDGGVETKVESKIPIKTGDLVQLRYRSYGNFNDYNVGAYTAWGAWFGTTVNTLDKHYIGASGEPAFTGSWGNAVLSEPDNLMFTLTSDNILLIQGTVERLNNTTQTIFSLPVGFRPPPGVSFRGTAFSLSSPAIGVPFSISDTTGALIMAIAVSITETTFNFNHSFRL